MTSLESISDEASAKTTTELAVLGLSGLFSLHLKDLPSNGTLS